MTDRVSKRLKEAERKEFGWKYNDQATKEERRRKYDKASRIRKRLSKEFYQAKEKEDDLSRTEPDYLSGERSGQP